MPALGYGSEPFAVPPGSAAYTKCLTGNGRGIDTASNPENVRPPADVDCCDAPGCASAPTEHSTPIRLAAAIRNFARVFMGFLSKFYLLDFVSLSHHCFATLE